ncbi:MAG: FtsX-like permease family protein [bacterium]
MFCRRTINVNQPGLLSLVSGWHSYCTVIITKRYKEMRRHYAILAVRNIKKISLNAVLNCFLQVLCLSLLIIFLLHITTSSISDNYLILIFLLMIIILVIAGINYYNHASIQLLKRRNELELRLILGAAMKDLLIMIITESILRIVMATIFSLVIVDLIIPLLNQISFNQISLKKNFNWQLLPLILIYYLFIISIAWVNLKINQSKISSRFK